MKIFISHSSRNKNYGDLIVQLLRDLGIKEDEIIFTSNVVYGIPVGENIFNWLKSQIEEKPFVIYLLSAQYYDSIACLNEMGAAWVIESAHAAIFTPNFNLASKKFQSGVLDPREIGFYVNDEERIFSFIQLLSKNFDISKNPMSISQNVKKFISEIGKIDPQSKIKEVPRQVEELNELEAISEPIEVQVKTEKRNNNAVKVEKGDLYSKFIDLALNRMKEDELLLIHYMVDTSKTKLMTGWQEEHEISYIREWEKINDIANSLSKNYTATLRRFELRGLLEISAVTGSGNTKEFQLKDEIASNILDFPDELLSKTEEVVSKNFFEHKEEDAANDDFPF
ncbi:toll/interleukin-1 receptor domain-containing protein [Reichenbachiella sp. MALMAid0571]|uniref:toll/interleukin-1 receptor domain-containing protein n=1 Tax=Reichenbachiella sp. MALMAid0571 TaxID=3143939 RepID=UPI0032E00445